MNHLNVFGDVDAHCAELAGKDKTLSHALEAIERPFIRRRTGGFEGLFRIIVEQQVSVPSAQAIWARCREGVAPMTAAAALARGEEGLKALGLTRQKARYVYGLARSAEDGSVDLAAIAALGDADAAAALQQIKGVGPWTAAIYLLFCEGRVDIWPPGDVPLLGAWREARADRLKRPGADPVMAAFDAQAQRWTPYRGLAAHILWTYYAHIRGRTPI